MPAHEVDLYFSFRSPWSYYGASIMYDLQQEYALQVNLHIVNPIFIRYNDFFQKAHAKWQPSARAWNYLPWNNG